MVTEKSGKLAEIISCVGGAGIVNEWQFTSDVAKWITLILERNAV